MSVSTWEFGFKAAYAYSSREETVAAVTAALFERTAQLCMSQGRVDIALTGGTDGIAVLSAAHSVMSGVRKSDADPLSHIIKAIDFSKVHFWWGDERFVPADDPDRNALQARTAWLDSLTAHHGLPEGNIHEMPADTRPKGLIEQCRNDPDANLKAMRAAASHYQDELGSQLGDKGHLDIALFGVGPDGHFASLFPDRPQIYNTDSGTLVLPVTDSPKMPPLRLTLTAQFIQTASCVWVVATGQRKAEAVGRALREANNGDVPSSFAQGAERTIWFLDRKSAVHLQKTVEARL